MENIAVIDEDSAGTYTVDYMGARYYHVSHEDAKRQAQKFEYQEGAVIVDRTDGDET